MCQHRTLSYRIRQMSSGKGYLNPFTTSRLEALQKKQRLHPQHQGLGRHSSHTICTVFYLVLGIHCMGIFLIPMKSQLTSSTSEISSAPPGIFSVVFSLNSTSLSHLFAFSKYDNNSCQHAQTS